VLTKNYLGNQIKEDDIGKACGTYSGAEIHTQFWWRDLKVDRLEYLCKGRGIVLKWNSKK
jgi:hypothetical protein